MRRACVSRLNRFIRLLDQKFETAQAQGFVTDPPIQVFFIDRIFKVFTSDLVKNDGLPQHCCIPIIGRDKLAHPVGDHVFYGWKADRTLTKRDDLEARSVRCTIEEMPRYHLYP